MIAYQILSRSSQTRCLTRPERYNLRIKCHLLFRNSRRVIGLDLLSKFKKLISPADEFPISNVFQWFWTNQFFLSNVFGAIWPNASTRCKHANSFTIGGFSTCHISPFLLHCCCLKLQTVHPKWLNYPQTIYFKLLSNVLAYVHISVDKAVSYIAWFSPRRQAIYEARGCQNVWKCPHANWANDPSLVTNAILFLALSFLHTCCFMTVISPRLI